MRYFNRFLIVVFVLVAHTQAFSQVWTNGTSSPSSCDGFAYVSSFYSWTSWEWTDSTGSTMASDVDTLYNLCQGDYTLNYTDSSGIHSYPFSIVYSPCNGFNASLLINNTTLNACTGAATVTIFGGSGPYTFMWNANGTNVMNTSGFLTDLCAGPVTVTVADANGCSSTVSGVVLTDADCANFYANASATNATTPVACDGTGSVYVTGTAPYTYSWSNTATDTNYVTGLCPGSYFVEVTDAAGCSDSLLVVVHNPCDIFVAYAFGVANSDSVSCNGSLYVLPYGTAPYTYAWSNGVTTNTQSNVCAGNYSVITTDANGCVYTSSYYIADSIPGGSCSFYATLIASASTDPVFCNAVVSPDVAGTAPYTFLWSNGSTDGALTNACAGYYSVVITDANGCTANPSIYVVDSFPPNGNGISGYVSTNDETISGSCDGTANVIVYGGTAPYQYLQSTGATTASVTNLCSGTYSVVVIDAAGDTLFLDYLISNPGNTIINVPFPDSTAIDTLFNNLIENCNIDYNTIDSASIWNYTVVSADSVIITWAIFSSTGVEYIDAPYYVGSNGNGVYTFILSVYCPQKSGGQYLKVFDQLYLNNGQLGLQNATLDNTVVYPNPFSESVHIQFGQAGDYTIALYDLTGRRILDQQVRNTDKADLQQLSGLSKGEYILHITGASGTLLQKLIK